MKQLLGKLAVYATTLLLVVGTSLLWAETAQAKASEQTPHQVVEQTTQRVMKIIQEAQGYYDENPERFYQAIDEVLEDVVDFDSFARGVMGRYASKQMYMALDSKEEKKQFIENMKRFSKTFKDGLVRTYAKGLLAFDGNRIEVLPPSDSGEPEADKSVTVKQHIYGDAEKPYVVQYKLRQNREGEWKLRNVTIEAINLGRVYQSQFASAAKQYDGNISKVIDNWSVDPTATVEEATSEVESDQG